MSIATRTGDGGETALLFNRRVSKCDPRVEACGTVDELNAALGWARTTVQDTMIKEFLRDVQLKLVGMMGELATDPVDFDRYQQQGWAGLQANDLDLLDRKVAELESAGISFSGWATPGANPSSAALDVARTVCRRAERRVCTVKEAGLLHNQVTLVFLNRLADLLWLLARKLE